MVTYTFDSWTLIAWAVAQIGFGMILGIFIGIFSIAWMFKQGGYRLEAF